MALVSKVIMIQVKNDSEVLQVYFDAGGNSHVLKPGEVKNISKLVREEVNMNAGLKEIDALKKANDELAARNKLLADKLAEIQRPAAQQPAAKENARKKR